MKYDKLYDFLQDLSVCNGCGNELTIALIDGQKRSRIFLPKYIYDDKNILKGKEEFTWNWVPQYTNIVYLCRAQQDDLILYSLNRDHIKTDLITINIKSGQIKEDTEHAQSIIWNHKLGAYKYCAHDYCSSSYFAETSPFCLERRKNKIFSVTIAFEGYMLNLFGNSYMLTNSKDYPGKTLLIQHDSSIFKHFEIIKELPLIDFKLAKPKSLINKVQTILTFS